MSNNPGRMTRSRTAAEAAARRNGHHLPGRNYRGSPQEAAGVAAAGRQPARQAAGSAAGRQPARQAAGSAAGRQPARQAAGSAAAHRLATVVNNRQINPSGNTTSGQAGARKPTVKSSNGESTVPSTRSSSWKTPPSGSAYSHDVGVRLGHGPAPTATVPTAGSSQANSISASQRQGLAASLQRNQQQAVRPSAEPSNATQPKVPRIDNGRLDAPSSVPSSSWRSPPTGQSYVSVAGEGVRLGHGSGTTADPSSANRISETEARSRGRTSSGSSSSPPRSMIQIDSEDDDLFDVTERMSRDFGLQESLSATRALMAEQNSAYEKSLKADQEKARIKEEKERVAREKAEEEQKNKLAFEKRKQEARESLPKEPDPTDPGVITVAFRMPSGKTVKRTFRLTDTLQILHQFVLQLEETPMNYNVIRFPNEVVPASFMTLLDYGLKKELLHVTTDKVADSLGAGDH